MSSNRKMMRGCAGAALGVAGLLTLAMAAAGQTPRPRITAEVRDADRVVLQGTQSPRARGAADIGAVPEDRQLSGMALVFSLSSAQQADLDGLLVAQQDPASPLYHQWLTPDQFGARFGMSDGDLAKAESWLEGHGFTIDGVAHNRDRISFSGTAGQVASAFGAPLHFYKTGAETNFAPSSDISLPAGLAPVVSEVANLSSFRPRSRLKMHVPEKVQPNFTSSQTGSHFLSPKDIATIYDLNAAYTAGFTGAGQSIAVVGQSSISTVDVANFQSAAGVPAKTPVIVLVPGSGVPQQYSDDEAESDLDVEYSGAIAKGATVYFVYTGNSNNSSVFDSIAYAVDSRIAPVISDSYGECEPLLSSSTYTSLNAVLAQGAAQGQTIVTPAGDSGSEDCFGDGNAATSTREGLAVDFPASSQYVVAMGGTEFPTADVATTATTYWTSASGTDVIGSALSYIPEQVWNDNSATAANPLNSGGGGISVDTPRPSWQTGVPGIPTGNARLVPDVSLDASDGNAPYLLCSGDFDDTGVTGSCSNGFRDSSNQTLTLAGGTSFAAPIFAGMVAIINQARNSNGLGLINPTLYSLASNASIYASAFHDVTSGNNECGLGAAYCSTAAAAAYPAGVGYDEASGLGSVDFYNLLKVWPSSTAATLVSSTTSLSAATSTPVVSAADTITITVASGSGLSAAVPTGTVNLFIDGAAVNQVLTLNNGVATYTFSSTTQGTHVIVAQYSGDGVFAPSVGTTTLTVASSTAGGVFTVSSGDLVVSDGSSGPTSVVVTPSSGYSGTVSWSLSSGATITNSCFSISNLAVSGTNPVRTLLTIYTNSGSCSSLSPASRTGAGRALITGPGTAVSSENHPSPWRRSSKAMETVLAAFMLVGFFSRRSRRRLQPLLVLCLLLAGGIGLVGCGDNGSATTPPTTTGSNAARGNYTIRLTGTDTSSPSLTSSTTFTLVIQ